MANYADDTPPYVSGDKISTVVASLETSAKLMFNWFTDHQMKGNEDKWHVLLSTDETLQVKIGAALINSSKCEKLSGIKIDNKLTFDEHVISICKQQVQN